MLDTLPFKDNESWDEYFSLFTNRHYPRWMMTNAWSKMVTSAYPCESSRIELNKHRITVQNVKVMQQAKKSGTLEIIPTTIHSFSDDKAEVMLTNGMKKDVDICLLATGYKTSYPFLGQSALGNVQLSQLILHRHIIPVDPSLLGLTFIGTTGIQGGGFCQMEAEARWLLHQIASNRLSRREEHQKLVRNAGLNAIIWNDNKRRPSFVVTETLACDMGCEPQVLFSAFFSPFPWRRRVSLAAAFGPWLPHLYRLRGPHAKRRQAERIIVECAEDVRGRRFSALLLAVNIAHVLVLGAAACGLFVWVKRMLS